MQPLPGDQEICKVRVNGAEPGDPEGVYRLYGAVDGLFGEIPVVCVVGVGSMDYRPGRE